MPLHKLLILILALISSYSYSQTSHKQIIEATPLYPDEELATYVQSVLDKLVSANTKGKKRYLVYVLDSPDINAFITPAGNMYIYRGLLNHVTSEAELAGILAHELAHIRDRHALKLKSSTALQNVVSIAAAITARSSEVGNVVGIFAKAQKSGFGRKLELRADELGAKYLYNAGYSPFALIDVLTLLKNHQRFVTYKAKLQGQGFQTYHGVFASHPRNDKRLLEVIEQAGELPPNEDFIGRKEVRLALEGVVYGDNAITANTDTFAYIHRKHGIAVDLGNNWQTKENGDTVTFYSETDGISLAFETFREARHHCNNSIDSAIAKPLNNHDIGYYLIRQPNLLACIQIGTRSFHFVGNSSNPPLSEQDIDQLLVIINTFRRVSRSDYQANNTKNIYYQRAQPGDTFAKLARNQILGKHTEDYLRLINSFYPKGEPEPGYWLKLVK